MHRTPARPLCLRGLARLRRNAQHDGHHSGVAARCTFDVQLLAARAAQFSIRRATTIPLLSPQSGTAGPPTEPP